MEISRALSPSNISPPAGSTRRPDNRSEIRDAAQQFEALLIAQILRSAREGVSTGLGPERDASSDCAMDFGEQQVAVLLAQSGGFGIADMIVTGLEKASLASRATEPG